MILLVDQTLMQKNCTCFYILYYRRILIISNQNSYEDDTQFSCLLLLEQIDRYTCQKNYDCSNDLSANSDVIS